MCKTISKHLIGIFFEDINYAADGGLYAELVQNRDFEYSSKDGSHQGWDGTYAWAVKEGDAAAAVTIAAADPIHPNNPHYAVLEARPGVTLQNDGFDGISLKKGEKYDFSLFARVAPGSKGGKVVVCLLDQTGREICPLFRQCVLQRVEETADGADGKRRCACRRALASAADGGDTASRYDFPFSAKYIQGP